MKISKIFSLFLSLLFLILVIYFISINDIVYAFISAILFILSIITYIRIRKMFTNPTELFIYKVNKIIKTYDSVLVEIETLPKLSDKKIIKATTFKDMANAEYELRKPIYYIKSEHTCDFILLDKKNAYVYIVKESNEYNSVLEICLSNIEKGNKSIDKELDLIDNLDKTTVIKLDNMKELVVSPVRKQVKNKKENDEISEENIKVDIPSSETECEN